MSRDQIVDALGKLLVDAGASFGTRRDDVFDEWLAYTTVVVETALRPFRDGMSIDFEAVGREEARLRERFSARHGNFDHLINAFRDAARLWITWSGSNIYDALGVVYTIHMNPNMAAGQFFTPWPVGVVCAETAIGGREAARRMVFDRLREAAAMLADANPIQGALADCMVLMAAAASGRDIDQAQLILLNLLPLIRQYYEPITIYDPTCGSGGLLLAAASLFPSFANWTGLVQYYGSDIDATCVDMAKLNMKIYGLNGWGLGFVPAWLMETGQARPDNPPLGPISPDEALTVAPFTSSTPAGDGRVIDHDLGRARQMAFAFEEEN